MATSAIATYGGQKLEPYYLTPTPATTDVALADGTYLKGTVLGELTATPGKCKPYASGNSDGSQVPKAILAYDCVVTSGKIALTSTAGQLTGPFGETWPTIPAYFNGAFKTAELTGFDANAATVLGGALISGSVSDGVYKF